MNLKLNNKLAEVLNYNIWCREVLIKVILLQINDMLKNYEQELNHSLSADEVKIWWYKEIKMWECM